MLKTSCGPKYYGTIIQVSVRAIDSECKSGQIGGDSPIKMYWFLSKNEVYKN